MTMDLHRSTWNKQQQVLKSALVHPEKHPEWLDLFLTQHAQVHATAMSGQEGWTFEDEVVQDLDETSIRKIPDEGEHSIAWILFHLARIEDVTMNMLVAGSEQLLKREGWLIQMNAPIDDTGNAMNVEKVANLSRNIEVKALRAYRIAVGRNTRMLVSQLRTNKLNEPVERARLEKVKSEGAVVTEAPEVLEYWGKKTIAGLLLMPATRHCVLHLNEALRIRYCLSR
jgi:hypothetical protein